MATTGRSTPTCRCRFAGAPPHVPADNPTGLYRRGFDIPADWDGRRIVLDVGGAESVLYVWVNGQRGRHSGK